MLSEVEASPRWLCYVILSETKDLKACTTVHRHGDLEILHCVQNDIVRVQNDKVCVQRNIAPTRKHTTKQ